MCSDFLVTAVMVLVFIQSGLAFLALFPIVHFGICLLDALLMDSSRIAQHCEQCWANFILRQNAGQILYHSDIINYI